MQGSLSILGKNLKNLFPGTVALLSQAGPMYTVYKKMKDRQWEHAPQSVRDMEEAFETTYQKRGISQTANMWVDPDLSTAVTREDLARLSQFQCDAWRAMHGLGAAACLGGYSVPLLGLALGNDTFMPSTFNATKEETAKWREAQDLYRYKFAPLFLNDIQWYLSSFMIPPAPKDRAFDELWEKNDVRRDPKIVRVCAEMYDMFLPMAWMRRRAARNLGRAMGLPTFPMWAKLCMINRIRAYWEVIWNEDYMTMRDRLHETMSDEELHDYAWRRFLAPYDKGLTRDDVMRRVEDYFEALGQPFLEKGETPNIHTLAAYCLGYYNDPAYLVEDIAELEKNDFENIASWGKDAYLRRLEFENGPLRDQVEAHTQKLLAAQKAPTKSTA